MTVSPPTSTTSTASAKQAPIVAGMAGISLQEPKSNNPPAYSSVHAETGEGSSITTSTKSDKDPELQWFLDIFQNAKGETFAKLFDLLTRRNDQAEEHIHRQVKTLPAGNSERKTQLALELLELRMGHYWLQERKKRFLADPKEQEYIREEVMVKIMGMTKKRDPQRNTSELDTRVQQSPEQTYEEYNPSTPLGEIQWQEPKLENTDEIRLGEQDSRYWRSKVEEAARETKQKLIEDEAMRRKKYAEDAAKWKKQYEETAAKWKKQHEENAAKWQKQIEEDSAKWQKKLQEDQVVWMKQDAEEYARWQKKDADDFARWQKQDAEYLAKWQKKDVAVLAQRRIKATEDVVKLRAKEARDLASSRAKEIADRVGSA
ncbi:hypothetical protein CPB97_001553 [Podila verticillata]|nr:hypothetical protein CPB97_001553 [Podila verticillata]